MTYRKKILIAIIAFIIVIVFLTPVIVGPILKNKLKIALNEKYPHFIFDIENVQWRVISSNVKLNSITIFSKSQDPGPWNISAKIESIQFKGIKPLKALFENKYEIDEVIISSPHIDGTGVFKDKKKLSSASSFNIQIGNLVFDQINIALKDSASAKIFSIQEGHLNLGEFKIEKQDTVGAFKSLDFNVEQIYLVSADSMYTYKARGIAYSDSAQNLSVEELNISPNYKDYEFTARYKHEIDRIETVLNRVSLFNFPVMNYFSSGDLVSSYLAIEKMDLNVFRDKRKEDNQVIKPFFQELIYNFPGFLRIDSVGLKNGNITYSEHGEKAIDPGYIDINELNARIYNVTNDSVYKTRDTTLQIRAEAKLMGKSKMTVFLKAPLFDPQNTFSLKGTLAAIEVKEMNSILVKNAFFDANSAKIDKLNFDFTANNSKSAGKLILLYNGLNITIKNKNTDHATAGKKHFFSFIANTVALDSNPLPGEEVRVGSIDYQREPTKSFFNYCLKSIVSGIQSSVIKNQVKKKTLLQKIFGPSKKKKKDQE